MTIQEMEEEIKFLKAQHLNEKKNYNPKDEDNV